MKAADGPADIDDASHCPQQQDESVGPAQQQLAHHAAPAADAGAGRAAVKPHVDAHSGDGSDSDGGKESYSSSGECATGSQAGTDGGHKRLTGSGSLLLEHEQPGPLAAVGPDSLPAGAGDMQLQLHAGALHHSEEKPGDVSGGRDDGAAGGAQDESKSKPKLPRPEGTVSCPRCGSDDTKFCYYNNYNVKQPRYFCKACQRYWTAGGMLRNVPVGAGKRKNKIGRDRQQVPALHPSQPAPPGTPPTSTQLPVSLPLNALGDLIKHHLPATPPAAGAPLPPQYAQSLRTLLQASPNPLLPYQTLTAAAAAAAAPPPAHPLPQAPAAPAFNQTPFANINALLTQLSQASRTLPPAQQEALNDPAAAVAAAVAAATAAGLPANTLLDPRFVSQLQQHAVAAPPAPAPSHPAPSSPTPPCATPKQPRSPSAAVAHADDGSAPDGRRTRQRSMSPPPGPKPSGFTPYSTHSAPSTLPASGTTSGPPKFGHPAPAAPPAPPPTSAPPPATDPNAAALYEGIVKGLWNASLANHLAPTPPQPQPPASCPPLGTGLSPIDTLTALAATTPNTNDWLNALLNASKQQAAQQAALTAVVQAAVAQQQQQPLQPPPPMHLPQQQPQQQLQGGGAAALQQALQAQALQAAALQAGLGAGWQAASNLPSNNGNSSGSNYWPGLWPPSAQMAANFAPAVPPQPQGGGVPGFLAALDAQRVLAQSLYPDASTAAAVAAAAAAQQHPNSHSATAALAANLLAATQQQPPSAGPQQPSLQPPPLQQNPNPWLAAAAAAAASGQSTPQAPSWPTPNPPQLSLPAPSGWVPTDSSAGSSGQSPFGGWGAPGGGLTSAQAAAVMAMAAGQQLDPALQAQVSGMLSHSLGTTAGSAFRAVGHGGPGGGMMPANGNISGLSNGSGTSTSTALVPQPKHARSFDSAQ